MYWYHPDHLGSSSFITGIDREVNQNIEYFPSGETFVENHLNSYNTPYKFNSKELDDETGYYYYGARYYNPRVSLWLKVDPLAETSRRWSTYTYAYNNPIRYIDPDGRQNTDWVRLKDGSNIYDSRVTNQAEAETAYGKGSEYRPVGYAYTSTRDGATYQLGDHGFYLKNGSEVGLSDDYAQYKVDTSGERLKEGLAYGSATLTRGGGNPIIFTAAAGALAIYSTAALIEKMTFEMSKIEEKPDGPQGVQYSLRATASGEYPVMTSGFSAPTGTTHLNAGDVWKYGETINPTRRYSETFKNGLRVQQFDEFRGSQKAIKVMEKTKIYNYFFQNGTLPPGNKIFR